MKSKTLMSFGIVSILLCVPALTSAEEAAAGASETGVVAPATSATVDSYSFGASNPQTPPGAAGAGMVAPPKPVPLRESPTRQGVVAPRDVATGQSSGKRMMASGTRPLPPKMEERMEKRDEMKANIEVRRGEMEEKREQMEERHEEMKEKIKERRGEMLKRMSTQMITRMKAAIERFTKLSDRVDSRIAKLKEKGVSTATAEANIAIVRTKILEAKAAVSLAEASIASAVTVANAGEASSSTPVDAGKPVRDALQKARTAVVDAHKALVTALTSLKANVKIDVATGTPAVTP